MILVSIAQIRRRFLAVLYRMTKVFIREKNLCKKVEKFS